jgi:gamma-glutamyl-gamma-aminobutyrate hydrolase PuuD
VASSASDRSDRPLIGLSTAVETARYGVWEERAALLAWTYVGAVTRAGGSAVLLPPMPFDPAATLALLDGVVVTGGPDVDPSRYGATAHGETDSPREERDRWELALCQQALEMDLPLLAVCRGLQVLNVSLGGTLHQHLPDVVGHDGHRATLGHMSPNAVTTKPGSAVASILGPGTEGLCHHHQALDRLASQLQPVGFAADGTVEAVEVSGHRFAIGVQWHPEDNPGDDRLFTAFAEAAARYRGDHRRRTGAPISQPAPR